MAATNGAEATQVIARPQTTQVLPPQAEEPGSGRKVGLGVLIGILIVALLAGGGWLLAQALGGDDVEMVELPNYRGQEWSVVEADLQQLGLEPVRKNSPRDPDEFTPETVIRTEPAAGQMVPVDSTVEVTVAVEPEVFRVPNLTGLDREAAEAEILAANLVVGEVTEEPSDAPEGTVFSQEPSAGTEITDPDAEPVNFVISTGPDEVQLSDYTCRNVHAAAAELSQLGFTNVSISGERRPLPTACPFNENNVAEQEPSAGTTVTPDTPIVLYQGVRATPTDSPSPTP
jgi:serine/threonine-protein kinase